MKKVYISIAKIILISFFLTFFIIMLGGSMNPLIWREQLNRRVHPESLLSDTSTVESLNRDLKRNTVM